MTTARPLPSQEPISAHLAAQAVAALTRVDPVPGGTDLTELRVVQPALMARVAGPARLSLLATLDLEGATISGGELTAGAWGEGFIDRRHPHTYVHELLLTGDDLLGRIDGVARVSLTAGKGFAPFGTDDPMSRPVLRYPVNHHLAQVLERAVMIGAVNYGPVTAEVGLFNGDEPEEPDQWPLVERFGDSWSGRLTGRPLRGVELQVSRAHVHSPENREGAGPDQEKWSLSGRWDGPVAGHPVYGLVEWAHNSEADGFFQFSSFLAEGANAGVIIYDVGNGIRAGSPESPVEVSRVVTGGGSAGSPAVHNGWWFHNPVTDEARYLFVGQEGPGGIGVSSSGDIHVVEVSDLADPREVANFHLDDAGTHNFWMDEEAQVLYAAYYNGGVIALDVSGTLSGDLSSRLLGRVRFGSETFTWGVMLANGWLYASDMLSGLWQVAVER